MPIPYYHEPSTHTTQTPPTPSMWGPYTGAGDFTANMIVILIIIFCALVLALALNFVIRYLFCARRHRPSDVDPEKPPLRNESDPHTDPTQTQIYSAGGTRLAGAEAVCAICLSEFADGDRVHVVPACNHGFHVVCIERWLRSKSSCPTCRSGCQVAVGPTAAS